MFKLANYILDHKEVAPTQVTTIKNFGGEEPMYKHIRHVPTSKAMELLVKEWVERKPVYPNVRKETLLPVMTKSAQQEPPGDTWWDKNVKQNAQYLRYVLGHKYNVADAGVKMGLEPKVIIKHDWSKLKPHVFVPYKEYFYGPEGRLGNRSHDTYVNFRKAVGEHYLTEEHHSNKLNLGKAVKTEMESVADWYSVGKTNAQMKDQFFPDFPAWWMERREGFLSRGQLKPETITMVDQTLKEDKNILSYLGI